VGKKSGPAPVDYTGAAQQQAQSSKEVTNMQNWANRPTINTPWGSQTWDTSASIDPATGQPVTQWTMNTNLTPESQAALDSQQRIDQGKSQAAEQLVGQATSNFQNPMDYSKFTGLYSFGGPGQLQTSLPNTPEGYANKAMEATWAAQKPQLDQRRADTETQLANMGLARGSEAWNREAARLDSGENAARMQAYQTGMGVQNQMFGQGLQGAQFGNAAQTQQLGNQMQFGGYQANQRQQQIAEGQARRGQTLNELNALLSGSQVSMPNMPNFNQAQRSESTQYNQAAQNTAQQNLDQWNAQQAARQSTMQGIGSLAGGAMMFSDARLKTVIGALGALKNGLRVWLYHNHVTNALEAGLIAQEVAALRPGAVAMHPSGYLCVNYTLAME
jgi:hypothetical protein